ncbi:tyrosine-type recombinase/integrase [Pedobacter sp. UYP1]|uniref:site-specific integrase n=1 Tax=Pedobacter sp. UYP1 TaxID=1756396 RepID=UPI00339943F5
MAHNLRFELRRETANKKGESPIALIIVVDGQRRKLPTGVKILPQLWDTKGQKAVYKTTLIIKKELPDVDVATLPFKDDINKINQALQDVKKGVEREAERFKLDGIPYSSEMLITSFKKNAGPTTTKADPKIYLLDFIRQYIAETGAITNKGSQTVYNVLAVHLDNYEKGIVIKEGVALKINLKKMERVTLLNADYSFMQSFCNYLIGDVGHLNTTAAKQITGLKTFLNKARKSGNNVNNTFQDYSVKRDKLEVIALTKSEFEAIKDLDLNNNRKLDQVRDVFIFGCVTGLRYSDLANLKRENIAGGFLNITVVKTKQKLNIPLSGIAYDILSKYPTTIKPLPVISNQKFNSYLKDLGKLAEINEIIPITRFAGNTEKTRVYKKYELVSVHTARKTFVTLSLERGMKAEEIMPITGHVSYPSFKRYVNVTKERAKTALLEAWGEPSQLKVVKNENNGKLY